VDDTPDHPAGEVPEPHPGAETEEEDAAEARAKLLREELARILSGEQSSDLESEGAESPRDFVHRRMLELKENEGEAPESHQE
jgi:hypothetical protein